MDAQYLIARNKIGREPTSLFGNEIQVLSIDDTAKIKVGAPALPRYHQIRSILTVCDQENLNDHDFPVPGYLIAISIYMFLEPSQSSTTKSKIFNSSIYDQEVLSHHIELVISSNDPPS